MARTLRRAFTLVEMLLCAVIVIVLVLILGPQLVKNRKMAADPKQSITWQMKRIDSAKAQYILDHQLKPGAPLTLEQLVKSGHLSAVPDGPEGVRYTVGAVGEPVTYTYSESDAPPDSRKNKK